jgi:hypothetical protein
MHLEICPVFGIVQFRRRRDLGREGRHRRRHLNELGRRRWLGVLAQAQATERTVERMAAERETAVGVVLRVILILIQVLSS